jgi:hypothetical protein
MRSGAGTTPCSRALTAVGQNWFKAILVWTAVLGPAVLARAQSGTGSFEVLGTIPGPADFVEVHGTRAYVVAGPSLTVVDIQNPAAPRPLGSYNFPERIFALKLAGQVAYAAVDFFGLGILDISKPGSPTLLSSLKLPGQALSLTLIDNKVAVANRISGLAVVDVSDPAKPVSLGSVYADGYAVDVASSGTFAFVIDYPNGVIVVDVSKPGPPDALSMVSVGDKPRQIAVTRLAGTGAVIACMSGDQGHLLIYDLSNPAAPTHLTTYETPGPHMGTSGPTRATGLALYGSAAYVARGASGLQMFDLSNPSKPLLASSFKTAAPARDVTVTNSHLFVVIGPAQSAAAGGSQSGVLIVKRTP